MYKPLDAIKAIAHGFNRDRHGGEQLARAGVAQRSGLDLADAHRALAGEQPLAVDALALAEADDELDAGGLAGNVAAGGLGVGAGDLTDLAVGHAGGDGGESVMKWGLIHARNIAEMRESDTNLCEAVRRAGLSHTTLWIDEGRAGRVIRRADLADIGEADPFAVGPQHAAA